MNRGWSSGTSKTASGSAGGGVAFFDFLAFLGLAVATWAPRQMTHTRASTMTHCHNCKKDPEEPEAVEPELAELKESLPLDPSWREPEFDEARDAEERDPEEDSKLAEESQYSVVVGLGLSAITSGVVVTLKYSKAVPTP